MKIQSIMRRISPAYNRYVERKLARGAQKANEIVQEVSHELAARRSAVEKYLTTGQCDFRKIYDDFEPSFYNLNLSKFGEVIEQFGDDVAQIRKHFGDYGLSLYAKLNPKNLIKDRSLNIEEIEILPDKSFNSVFGNYLLKNKVGVFVELVSRFGESGAYMLDRYSKLGYVETYADSYRFKLDMTSYANFCPNGRYSTIEHTDTNSLF